MHKLAHNMAKVLSTRLQQAAARKGTRMRSGASWAKQGSGGKEVEEGGRKRGGRVEAESRERGGGDKENVLSGGRSMFVFSAWALFAKRATANLMGGGKSRRILSMLLRGLAPVGERLWRSETRNAVVVWRFLRCL